jgi:hypothetical protein
MARRVSLYVLGKVERWRETEPRVVVKLPLDLSHSSPSTRSERMPGDWAQLKQRRAAKDRTAPTPASPRPLEQLDTWISNALPPTLAVEQIRGRGRGLVAPAGAKAGTTLLATAPLVSVLDARNLPHRCSHCFRSVDDFHDSQYPTPPKLLLQCSLCHTLQYCSSVTARNTVSQIQIRLPLTWTLARAGMSNRRLADPQEGMRRPPSCDQAAQRERLETSPAGCAVTSARSVTLVGSARRK